MNNKTKNIVVTLAFSLFIAFFTLMCVLCGTNPKEISEAERRPLAQFPSSITMEGIVDKSVIDGFESFSVDQFPFREFFRGIKANFQMKIFNLKENNGLALEDGYIAKVEDKFNPTYVQNSIGRLEYIYDKYLKNTSGNRYLSIIPDKNYYFAQDYGYISPDYDKLVSDVTGALSEMNYIDLFPHLELEDFYKTDTHWRQEKILDALNALAKGMGVSEFLSGEYEENVIDGDFRGVYHGQSALRPAPDKITYLTNDAINGCKVYNYDVSGGKINNVPMYNLDLFDGEDGYNVFLSGAAGNPIMRIVNNGCENKNTLIVFRDSFGSSIVPLIAEAYRTVYVVDIRSIHPDMLGDYIKFEGSDVLFLYSSLVFNSNAFK